MTSHLTIGDKLRNYRQRYGSRLTSSLIAEPLVRALYWQQERERLEQLREDNTTGRDDHRWDWASADISEAAAEERKALAAAEAEQATRDLEALIERKVTHEMEAVL